MSRVIMSLMVAASLLLSFNAHAAVNLLAMGTDRPLTTTAARQLLGPVLLHDLEVLDTLSVQMTDIQRRDSMSVIFATVGAENPGFPVEIYVVTLNSRGFFCDGALLGVTGDAYWLTGAAMRLKDFYLCEDKYAFRHGIKNEPSKTIEYELVGDTLKVNRRCVYKAVLHDVVFKAYVNDITNHFLICADAMKQLPQTYKACLKTKIEHGGFETCETRGYINALGADLMLLVQSPVSAFNVEALNELVKFTANTVTRLKGEKYEEPTFENVMNVAIWVPALCLRHASVALPWIAAHQGNEELSECIVELANEGIVPGFKHWLERCVNNLTDQKARKWWLNTLKKVK